MTLFEQLLAARGLTEESKREAFLSPQYEAGHDPFLLPDVKQAVERLVLARERQDRM
jgi:single-stranded-DNA-specific exonuclease